jgi:hypothetical protein
MMPNKLSMWLAAVVLSSAVGCTSPMPQPVAEDLYLERLMDGYETREECREDGQFNCLQSITLCASGRAEAIVTDIIGIGEYTVTDDVATIELRGFDGPSPVTLDLASGFSPELPGRPFTPGTSTGACDR